MARSRGFSLVPKSVPMRQRTNFYQEIVSAFVESGEKSAVVEGTERKPATLIQGLRKAAVASGHADIKVVQRLGNTYLTRD